MSKRQRSNREIRKPKQAKVKPAVPTASPVGTLFHGAAEDVGDGAKPALRSGHVRGSPGHHRMAG